MLLAFIFNNFLLLILGLFYFSSISNCMWHSLSFRLPYFEYIWYLRLEVFIWVPPWVDTLFFLTHSVLIVIHLKTHFVLISSSISELIEVNLKISRWIDLFLCVCWVHFFLRKYLFIWLCRVFIVACGLNCSVACGIFVPQPGIEPSSLHCKVDS